MHGNVTHRVEFLHRIEKQEDTAAQTCEPLISGEVTKAVAYLVGFRIGGGLGIFRLFYIFYHFSDEGVAVVLILGHDNLKDKPQSSESKANVIISTLVIDQKAYSLFKTKVVKRHVISKYTYDQK